MKFMKILSFIKVQRKKHLTKGIGNLTHASQ